METNQVQQSSVVSSPMFAAYKAEEKLSFIRPYDPKLAIDSEGFRHAVVRFRDTGKNTVSRTAQMACIPQVQLPNEYLLDEKATKVLIGILEDQQDEILRSVILDNKSAVVWDDLSVSICLDLLTAVRVSQRLTSEQIGNWFDVAMVAYTKARAAERAKASLVTDAKVISEMETKTHTAYRDRFCKLAAPVPNIDQQAAIMMKNALAISKVADDIATALGNKLHQILNPVAANNGDL